jgi:hypothetical protein
LPIGYVTNPNKDFVALVQNDGKVLRIESGKSERIPLPEGEWRLLSYTIHVPGLRLKGLATRDSKPVSVRRGQAAQFPFGPPLRPVTKVGSLVGQEEAVLELFLLGTAGEFCKPVIRQGSRAMPEMTISTPAGRAVVRGRFRGGCTEYSLIYQWKLPSELADEYHVRVRVKAGPFEVDDTGYSVIPRSELVRRK